MRNWCLHLLDEDIGFLLAEAFLCEPVGHDREQAVFNGNGVELLRLDVSEDPHHAY